MTADNLAHEGQLRPRQTVVAAIGALLLVAAAAVQLSGPQAKVSELTIQLINVNKRNPLDIIGGVFEGLGVLALIWTLSFLFDVARARKPEMAPAVRIAVIAGGVVAAAGGIAYAAVIASKARDFVHNGALTYPQANSLTKGAALPALQTLDIAAQFVLSIGLILISLNAMRVGLLTRFMGYFGIVVGAAAMLLIGSPPAVALQVAWMIALALLYSGQWPGGDPPAWRTGRAEPWPTSQEMREQRIRAASAGGRGKSSREEAPRATEPEAVGSASGPAQGRTRASTPKRKRKRRR